MIDIGDICSIGETRVGWGEGAGGYSGDKL